jgi:anti-sigma factor ChrR (cupin superfamily)
MSAHVSKSQLERFAVGALEEEELVSVATHTADCESCDKAFVEELRSRVGSGPFAFTLNPEFWFRHDHLKFEDLVGLADETVDDELKEIFDIHLKTCSRCKEDLTSFLAFLKMENESTDR